MNTPLKFEESRLQTMLVVGASKMDFGSARFLVKKTGDCRDFGS